MCVSRQSPSASARALRHHGGVGVDARPVPDADRRPAPPTCRARRGRRGRALRRRGSAPCGAGWGSRRRRPLPRRRLPEVEPRLGVAARSRWRSRRPRRRRAPRGRRPTPAGRRRRGVGAQERHEFRPRPGSRLMTVRCAAPASAVSTAIARAAPPAPNSAIDRPAGSATVRSAARKPWPSVFSPTSSPSRCTTQLTAPMIAADAPSRSRCAITATLCGREQLKPAHPIAPRRARRRRAGRRARRS